MTDPVPAPARPAGLLLVLAACAYDGLITVAILFAATALALVATGGEAIPPGTAVYEAWLLAAAFPYFGFCWVRGQTLGMRAWRLRIQGPDGAPPRWPRAGLRYLGALLSWALLGAGFLWMLADPERKSLHDRISGTRIVRDRR